MRNCLIPTKSGISRKERAGPAGEGRGRGGEGRRQQPPSVSTASATRHSRASHASCGVVLAVLQSDRRHGLEGLEGRSAAAAEGGPRSAGLAGGAAGRRRGGREVRRQARHGARRQLRQHDARLGHRHPEEELTGRRRRRRHAEAPAHLLQDAARRPGEARHLQRGGDVLQGARDVHARRARHAAAAAGLRRPRGGPRLAPRPPVLRRQGEPVRTAWRRGGRGRRHPAGGHAAARLRHRQPRGGARPGGRQAGPGEAGRAAGAGRRAPEQAAAGVRGHGAAGVPRLPDGRRRHCRVRGQRGQVRRLHPAQREQERARAAPPRRRGQGVRRVGARPRREVPRRPGALRHHLPQRPVDQQHAAPQGRGGQAAAGRLHRLPDVAHQLAVQGRALLPVLERAVRGLRRAPGRAGGAVPRQLRAHAGAVRRGHGALLAGRGVAGDRRAGALRAVPHPDDAALDHGRPRHHPRQPGHLRVHAGAGRRGVRAQGGAHRVHVRGARLAGRVVPRRPLPIFRGSDEGGPLLPGTAQILIFFPVSCDWKMDPAKLLVIIIK